MADDIATYLKYTNLQLAAESLFGLPDGSAPGTLRNQIYGGFGNDQIIGNGGDALYGNDGDDRLYANTLVDIADAMTAAQQDQQASVGTVLEGGRGDDLLIGGDSNWLYGGAGHDTLIGGGGVDLIQGDSFEGASPLPGEAASQYDCPHPIAPSLASPAVRSANENNLRRTA